MSRPIALSGLVAICLLGTALQAVRAAEPGSRFVRVLSQSPACVEKRLGLVTVELGSKEENNRSAMRPPRVSYRKAFARLAEAAQEKGGDAVILRDHRAAYLSKGGHHSWRPSYVWLKGAAVRLEADAASCELVVIDPGEYARDLRRKQRQDVSKDAGVSF